MKQKDAVAYHEIGHCVVALCLGVQVCHLSIRPDTLEGKSRDGHASLGPMWPDQAIPILLAGAVAEALYSSASVPPCELEAYASWGARSDYENACARAIEWKPAAGRDRRILAELLRKGQREAIDILRSHWGIVVHLAWETQLAGRVSGEEFARVAAELMAMRS